MRGTVLGLTPVALMDSLFHQHIFVLIFFIVCNLFDNYKELCPRVDCTCFQVQRQETHALWNPS
jgi:hypothetical protein